MICAVRRRIRHCLLGVLGHALRISHHAGGRPRIEIHANLLGTLAPLRMQRATVEGLFRVARLQRHRLQLLGARVLPREALALQRGLDRRRALAKGGQRLGADVRWLKAANASVPTCASSKRPSPWVMRTSYPSACTSRASSERYNAPSSILSRYSGSLSRARQAPSARWVTLSTTQCVCNCGSAARLRS
jgi:hypothetical protein